MSDLENVSSENPSQTAYNTLSSQLKENDETEKIRIRKSYKHIISQKDSLIFTLQCSNSSLNSQLKDRLKQIEILQAANQTKEQHIRLLKEMNQKLEKRVYSYHQGKAELSSKQRVNALKKQFKVGNNQLAEVSYLSHQLESNMSCCPTDNISSGTCSDKSIVYVDDKTCYCDNFDKLKLQLKSAHEQVTSKEALLVEANAQLDSVRLELKHRTSELDDQSFELMKMKNELNNKTISLLEFEIVHLQTAISEKDTMIGTVEELHGADSTHLEKLQKEKTQLTKELKDKIQEKMTLMMQTEGKNENESSDTCSYNPQQICENIRILEKHKTKLRGYIDQLIAIVLNKDIGLLEGLPRLQMSAGMKPDLLRVASVPELLDELQQNEEDLCCLQSYAALILENISNTYPDLLNIDIKEQYS